jgi:hypothetical protein
MRLSLLHAAAVETGFKAASVTSSSHTAGEVPYTHINALQHEYLGCIVFVSLFQSNSSRTMFSLSHRHEPWNIQNVATRKGQSWQRLVSVAADALILATGGFRIGDTRMTADSVQQLPVFAQPFSSLKKTLQDADIDTGNLTEFIWNKAYRCK